MPTLRKSQINLAKPTAEQISGARGGAHPSSPTLKDMNSAGKPKEKALGNKPRRQGTMNAKIDKQLTKTSQVAESEPTKAKKPDKKLKIKIATTATAPAEDAQNNQGDGTRIAG